jgi:large subunit ribosomal protein L24
MKIHKGDTVKIVSGNDKGKTGKVLKTFPEVTRIIVEGVNLVKRHTRPSQRNRKGGIVEKEGPIHVSNVMLFDNRVSNVTRVGYRLLNDGTKVRINKKSGEIIE